MEAIESTYVPSSLRRVAAPTLLRMYPSLAPVLVASISESFALTSSRRIGRIALSRTDRPTASPACHDVDARRRVPTVASDDLDPRSG
jgi:hypothetical protein